MKRGNATEARFRTCWPRTSATLLIVVCLLGFRSPLSPVEATRDRESTPASSPSIATSLGEPPFYCAAFGPYVKGYNPEGGPHPSKTLIDQLLDRLIQQTAYRCILTYGVLNGLDYTFEAARARGLKVIAIIWLDASNNQASVDKGIEVAKAYPDTIVRLSCGSEMRTRHGNQSDLEITNCIDRVRAAGVTQPITSIDTWWEWCDRQPSCQTTSLSGRVDWIGINVYPWWENKFSGPFPCTTAEQAADFHVARFEDVRKTYAGKEVLLTEFGWPAGPTGYSETNRFTGQRCGLASQANQDLVIRQTLDSFRSHGWSAITFEAYREEFKAKEAPVGPFWGICEGTSPYRCWQVRAAGDLGDFDGDAKTDVSVYRASSGQWFVLPSVTGFDPNQSQMYAFGTGGDQPVKGDFDGDSERDAAVYRPSTGTWFWLKSSTNSAQYAFKGWGVQAQGDTPVPGDYDGDGKADPTVFRPVFGTWFVLRSSTNYTTAFSRGWGQAGDVLMPADYDGDGATDMAVFRPTTGQWFVLPSSTGFTTGRPGVTFGRSGDLPLHGDFDGAAKHDFAVYGPSTGTWFWLKSSTNNAQYAFKGWGVQARGDTPVPGDYDGDGNADPTVFRPAFGTWFVLKSSTNYTRFASYGWGAATDIPLGGQR